MMTPHWKAVEFNTRAGSLVIAMLEASAATIITISPVGNAANLCSTSNK
jgi:hypothetical protein